MIPGIVSGGLINGDPIAASIKAKLTCFWPLDTTNGSVMANVQPEVIANGPENATLKYGAAPSAVSGRTAGRYAGSLTGAQAFVTNNGTGATLKTDSAGSSDFCMFGWFYANSNPTTEIGIATRYDAASTGDTSRVSIAALGDGRARGWFSNGSVNQNSIAPSIPVAQWVFSLLQRRANKLKLGFNNSIFGNEVDVTGIAVPGDSNSIYFGSMGAYFLLSGKLQDWGWIKGASLTDAEIAWLYNSGLGRTYNEIIST